MNKVFDIKPRSLLINITPGCYFFDNEAAIGKTYLGNLLSKLSDADRLSACTITYAKNVSAKDIISYLKSGLYDVVFFDRLDLYITDELCEFLVEDCNNRIYLLDIKNLNKIRGVGLKYAELLLAKDKIEVVSV